MSVQYLLKTALLLAKKILQRKYHIVKHTISAAVVTEDGEIYTAVNIKGCDYSVCAERLAAGMAIAYGDSPIVLVCAVTMRLDGTIVIINPCGNCRQFFIDYAPNAKVITENGLISINDLLPNAYISNFEPIEERIVKYQNEQNIHNH